MWLPWERLVVPKLYHLYAQVISPLCTSTHRAGFRRGQSGQLPRGPHKKGPPQILTIPFEYHCA